MIKSIWKFLEALGEARYATFLARQGRIEEAKALYK
jgi:hypothetical protein